MLLYAEKIKIMINNNNNFKIKSVAYSFQVSHIGQLDFCNWLADDNTTG